MSKRTRVGKVVASGHVVGVRYLYPDYRERTVRLSNNRDAVHTLQYHEYNKLNRWLSRDRYVEVELVQYNSRGTGLAVRKAVKKDVAADAPPWPTPAPKTPELETFYKGKLASIRWLRNEVGRKYLKVCTNSVYNEFVIRHDDTHVAEAAFEGDSAVEVYLLRGESATQFRIRPAKYDPVTVSVWTGLPLGYGRKLAAWGHRKLLWVLCVGQLDGSASNSYAPIDDRSMDLVKSIMESDNPMPTIEVYYMKDDRGRDPVSMVYHVRVKK